MGKAIGISNFKVKDIQSLMKTAEVTPHVHQMKLNLIEYNAPRVDASLKYNMTVEAYSPLGRNSSDILRNPIVQRIAEAHNVSTYQIAIKWILQQGHHLVFQSTKEAHQRSDANVFGFELSAD